MRARNIKPALFKNELLGEAEPLFTLVFIGLWCAADRAGRLEDRPARLRVELVPYRSSFDMDAALSWLHKAGFIDRYVVDGLAIIQVVKFAEHQRPHANEVPSVLPAKVESASHQGRKRAQPRNGQGGKRFALIPSSLTPNTGYLKPDTGLHDTDSPHTALAPEVDGHASKYWDAIQKAWPTGNARKGWPAAKKHAVKLVAEGRAAWELLYRNVRAYAQYCHLTQTKVMAPLTYFTAEDAPWANAWDIESIRSPELEAREARYSRACNPPDFTSTPERKAFAVAAGLNPDATIKAFNEKAKSERLPMTDDFFAKWCKLMAKMKDIPEQQPATHLNGSGQEVPE